MNSLSSCVEFDDSNKEFQEINIEHILNQYPLEEKLRIVLKIHLELAKKWKDNYV